MLEKLFRSGAGVKTLGIVLFEDGLHLREIARRGGISAPEAKRELEILCSMGLLLKEKKGNMLIFRLDTDAPFLPEIRGLYLKTEGVFAKLKCKLAKLKGIKYAFIFGSMARGEEQRSSDVDLLVVGSIAANTLSGAIFSVQKQTGREINFIHWSEQDLRGKLTSQSPFLKNVLKKEAVWLAGDKNEFAGAVKKAAH